jgi:twitching motility protein PilT
MHINDLLKVAVERKASDLHLKVSAFPVIRIDGQLTPLTDTRREKKKTVTRQTGGLA